MGLNLFISYLQSNPAFFFAVLITVVVSITLHELAHGFVALQLGDDTPELTGHMTLNPIVHMGVQSLFLLAIAGIAFGAMPVDRTRLRGKYAEAMVAAAGPAMNLLLSLLSLGSLALWQRFDHTSFLYWGSASTNGRYLLLIFGETNALLMLFNLLPVPPLDGSWIAANIFPAYRRLFSADIVRGITTALFLALMLGGGNFIRQAADRASLKLLTTISDRPAKLYWVIEQRLPITSADKIDEFLQKHSDEHNFDDRLLDR